MAPTDKLDIEKAAGGYYSTASGGGSSTSSGSKNPMVYKGKTTTKGRPYKDVDGRTFYRPSTKPAFDSEESWQAQFYTAWQNKSQRRWIVNAIIKGDPSGYWARTGVSAAKAQEVWNWAGSESAKLAAQGIYRTPQQVINMYSGGSSSSGGGGATSYSGSGSSGGGGGGGGGGGTYTSTQYDISNPKVAKGLTESIFTAAFGRGPTKEELRKYREALNAAEKANPTVTTTTVSGQSSTSRTTGGTDKQQVLLDKARKDPESQAYTTNQVFEQAMQYLSGG